MKTQRSLGEIADKGSNQSTNDMIWHQELAIAVVGVVGPFPEMSHVPTQVVLKNTENMINI